jgi:biopolymer transport protein ExbB
LRAVLPLFFYAEIELARLERGFFILEIIIAGAPLLGLLGTVTGLVTVFSNYQITQSSDTGLFVEGIALALTTTIFGLIIALPALIGHGYLCRRIELFSADINLEVERLLQMHYQS